MGCGFHLRGTGNQIGLKHFIWHLSNSGEMTQPLEKELLRQRGVKIIDSVDSAVIKLTKIDFNRQTKSINHYGNVDDFLYTLHIEAQVYYHDQAWGDPIDIVVERYMTYRADSLVLQDEERHLKNEIYASAADAIVNRLYFLPNLIEDSQ